MMRATSNAARSGSSFSTAKNRFGWARRAAAAAHRGRCRYLHCKNALAICKLDPAELKRVETPLNNRPRKTLGYRTPAEVFNQRLTGAEQLVPASQA